VLRYLISGIPNYDPEPLASPTVAEIIFRTAASREANGSDVLVLALFTDDHPCAPAEFQRIGAVYDSGTRRG
jgi:hypothetical protein